MSRSVHAIVMRRFDAPAERVFDACLDPAWVGRWMFGPDVRDERIVRLTLDARVGGRFSFVVERAGTEIDHIGEYLEIDRPKLLVFTWSVRDHSSDGSRVIIEITPYAEACDVKLTHLLAAKWSAHVDQAASAWAKMLDALGRVITSELRRT